MSYYSVLDVTPTNDDWVADYLESANRLVEHYGGKYLARTTSHQQLEGKETNAALRIVIEWPSEKAAKDFMADPDYVPHLKTRTEGSVSNHFLIEGKDELAGE